MRKGEGFFYARHTFCGAEGALITLPFSSLVRKRCVVDGVVWCGIVAPVSNTAAYWHLIGVGVVEESHLSTEFSAVANYILAGLAVDRDGVICASFFAGVSQWIACAHTHDGWRDAFSLSGVPGLH